ncbi:MAG TPA: dihydroorotase [Candidatus Binataceae bacterium]|nr:dihydroorotase [Candidatus Binataceae bacterium]
MNVLFIRGGRVIDPVSGMNGPFDVLMRNGKIEAVAPADSLSAPLAAITIDASGKWVVPGLVDPHVHLRDPGFPEKETIASGLRAAAAGGFTTVAAMANTRPVNDTPEITRYMIEHAQQAHAARLIPVSAVTRGLGGTELVNFDEMYAAGARMFSDDGMSIEDTELLVRALREADRLECAVSLHEEDRSLSCDGALNAGPVAEHLGVTGYSDDAESARVDRDLEFAPRPCGSMHFAHVSTAESLDIIRETRTTMERVTCEVTPHHFTLDDTAALTWGPNAKMNPPLRSRDDVQAVRAAIADGTVDIIASDHAPHDPKSKRMDALAGHFGPGHISPQLDGHTAEIFAQAANGIVGLETSLGLALGLVHLSVIDEVRLIELMSVNPAELLGLAPYSIANGAVADVTVIDPDLEWTIDPEKFLSKSRNTPYAGMKLKGRAIVTIVGGEIVFDGRR